MCDVDLSSIIEMNSQQTMDSQGSKHVNIHESAHIFKEKDVYEITFKQTSHPSTHVGTPPMSSTTN